MTEVLHTSTVMRSQWMSEERMEEVTITAGQNAEKGMPGIGEDAKPSELELDCRRDSEGEVLRGSVLGSRCVFTVKQLIQGNAASTSLETRAGMRKTSVSRERGDQGQKKNGWPEA